jgi:hypothetical protein
VVSLSTIGRGRTRCGNDACALRQSLRLPRPGFCTVWSAAYKRAARPKFNLAVDTQSARRIAALTGTVPQCQAITKLMPFRLAFASEESMFKQSSFGFHSVRILVCGTC